VNDALHTALTNRLLASADDELILAHRNAEWTGHAPILEEDIALANIAQDELGHGTIWYGLVEALTGDDPDRLAFFRDASQFCSAQLVEQPRGDWAFTMLRQYLFDAYELTLLARLAGSAYQPAADAAVRMRNEEIYHYRHSSVWVRRLALGTEESHRRMQRALNELWPLTGQLFSAQPGDEILMAAGYWPDFDEMKQSWMSVVMPFLEQGELVVSDLVDGPVDRSEHSGHLNGLLADMQMVARADREAVW